MTRTVLTVINDWPNAERILASAQQVATSINAEVFVYCPVSSELEELNRYVGFENFEQVKCELLEGANSRLEELPGIADLASEVVWQTRMYKGVADKADELSAEMIVMGRSHHNLLGDLLHKPDDWHLLRDSRCPVLILNPQHQPYHSVVVALDAMDDNPLHQELNGRILDEAALFSEALKLPLDVVTVVVEPVYAYPDVAVVDSSMVTRFHHDAVALAQARLNQTLGRLGVRPHRVRVESGRVEDVLQQCVADAGLLVIGTIANKGVKGFFIGNTAERLLRNLQGDMLVVN